MASKFFFIYQHNNIVQAFYIKEIHTLYPEYFLLKKSAFVNNKNLLVFLTLNT